MFSKMLKLSTVLFALMAFFVIPQGVLSNGSSSSDPEIKFNKKCGFPNSEEVITVKDDKGNFTAGCSAIAASNCKGKSAEYEVVEAAGCTNDLEYEYPGKYVLCKTEKKAIPNGTVDCKLSDDETSCEDGDNFSIKNRFYKYKCTATLFNIPPGMTDADFE